MGQQGEIVAGAIGEKRNREQGSKGRQNKNYEPREHENEGTSRGHEGKNEQGHTGTRG